MILLIDNYDSFSFNVYQLIGKFESDIKVVRNDALTISDIRALSPSHIILSPGPGKPIDAGICEEAAKELAGEIPILGICLGHQAIVEAFGGVVGHAKELYHGKSSQITLYGSPIFKGLPERVQAARYHSLAAERESLPDVLEITAQTSDGEIMAVRHKEYDVYGLQFHPESILTPQGDIMIKNFLEVNNNDQGSNR